MILLDSVGFDIDTKELERFVKRAQRLAGVRAQVDILISGSQRLRRLNRRFRRRDKATDVLSFPHPKQGGGDIAISADIAAESVSRFGHSLQDELKVLILHGLLHLAGYDHERDNGEMATRELTLRAKLGLPTSLTERSER